MLHADGLGVALVRNHKDYNEKNVSQDHMEQSLRHKNGDRFLDDRCLAHYAAVHRQIRTDSDEVVKVAIRFDPKLFKMFTSDILQVKILVGKHTHTHHIGEPTGGFVHAEVLGMPDSDKGIALPCSKSRKVLSAGIRSTSRGFRAADDTVAIFITRGRFASDRKSSRSVRRWTITVLCSVLTNLLARTSDSLQSPARTDTRMRFSFNAFRKVSFRHSRC